MNILFGGDVMPGGVLPYQDKYIDETFSDYISRFDFRIATLECAIGDDIPFDKVKMDGKKNIIYARNNDFFRVLDLKLNVVSLANNHLFDLGEEGMRNTIRLLDEAGIRHCGAGLNIEEARKPVILSHDGKRIAFIAFCQYDPTYIGHVPEAAEGKAGIYVFSYERLEADIKSLKSTCDLVFVLPHWGHEYQYVPTQECINIARFLVDSGADGIFASHPHQIQPLIEYKGKPIAFSMGNFLFPDFYMYPPRPIWYPESGQFLSSIPRVKHYPKRIDKPCCQVWRHMSRVGMMVMIDTDKNEATYELNYLAPDNILHIYHKPLRMRFRMKWMKMMLESNSQPMLLKFYNSRLNVLRKAFHLINRRQSRR